ADSILKEKRKLVFGLIWEIICHFESQTPQVVKKNKEELKNACDLIIDSLNIYNKSIRILPSESAGNTCEASTNVSSKHVETLIDYLSEFWEVEKIIRSEELLNVENNSKSLQLYLSLINRNTKHQTNLFSEEIKEFDESETLNVPFLSKGKKLDAFLTNFSKIKLIDGDRKIYHADIVEEKENTKILAIRNVPPEPQYSLYVLYDDCVIIDEIRVAQSSLKPNFPEKVDEKEIESYKENIQVEKDQCVSLKICM
ncbi:MAG: hypothetical protein MHMPM18_004423, partial [Marteilia pararefringens]